MPTPQPHHTRRGAPAGERGSVAMALLVIMIATTMVVALLVATMAGLRGARRAGDSANALQLADAGINDAVKKITAATITPFSGGASLGASGSYAYTATKDGLVCHLDSTGTDATGVKRRVLADAADSPLFSNAFFALATSAIKGTADSYTSPTNRCASSPGLGVVGSNGTITFTGGVGATNCRGAAWGYVADGCTFYGQTTIPASANRCPPAPNSSTNPQEFIPPAVTLPAGVPNAGAFSCPTGSNFTIPSGTHVYTDISLSGSCKVPSGTTAVLYATGRVTVGTDSGACKSVVNAPPATVNCSTFPTGWYKSNHPSSLQINVAGSGEVSFANHAIFWGVINAPNSLVTAAGGTPQVDVFGSVLANSAESAAQFAFHYDQALRSQLSTGQYRLANWREEAIG